MRNKSIKRVYHRCGETVAEYWEEINHLKEECNSYIQSIQLQPRVGGHKKLTVPLKKQTIILITMEYILALGRKWIKHLELQMDGTLWANKEF